MTKEDSAKMIIIAEKINGAIPSIKEAIANRDDKLIRERIQIQLPAKPDYLDCAPSTEPALEYDAMKWLIGIMEEETDTPICLDSPDVMLLKRLLDEGATSRPGMVNSVNEEGVKCETIFPIIAGTDWNVLGLTCDKDGIPLDSEKKVTIAKQIIDKADHYGVALSNLHIDPCVMSLSTVPTAMTDFIYCIKAIHEYAPEVKVGGALSNISFGMPLRKYVNVECLTLALEAGLDSCIMDPSSALTMGALYAYEALAGNDTGGRKYNRAYRKGILK